MFAVFYSPIKHEWTKVTFLTDGERVSPDSDLFKYHVTLVEIDWKPERDYQAIDCGEQYYDQLRDLYFLVLAPGNPVFFR